MDVSAKVALVTGGASGIGLGIVKKLLENDVRGIAIVDINPKGNEIAEELNAKCCGDKVIFAKADVSDKSELQSAFQRTIDEFGNLDIVFNNAGILCEQDAEKTYKINLIGATNCLKLAMEEFLLKYRSADEGVLINTASVLALNPRYWYSSPIYIASKCAIIGLTRSLSHEFHYKRTGVRVMAICPGITLTPIIEVDHSEYPEETLQIIKENPIQKVEDLTEHIIPILGEGKNGSIWKLEDKKREEVHKIHWETI